jgi:hypothetical protein
MHKCQSCYSPTVKWLPDQTNFFYYILMDFNNIFINFSKDVWQSIGKNSAWVGTRTGGKALASSKISMYSTTDNFAILVLASWISDVCVANLHATEFLYVIRFGIRTTCQEIISIIKYWSRKHQACNNHQKRNPRHFLRIT